MTQSAVMPEWLERRLAGTDRDPGEVQIVADEVPPLALFLSLGTQWRICPVSGYRLGLDYSAILTTAAMQGTEMTPALFADLRAMEVEALAALAEARKQ